MGAHVRLQDVSKRYGQQGVEALHEVSLEIRPGEFVALMGPSGCGKSTLLNLMGTIDQPSEGQLLFNEKNLAQLSEAERTELRGEQIGFVFQFFNLLSTLTVFENIALPLELKQRPQREIQERVEALLLAVGMQHRRNFFPAQLSGGEMQRTAIGRALVHQPALILADEPTGNLDTENGQAVLTLLQTLANTSRPTIIMATHSAEAAGFAQRTIHMRDGRIVTDE